MDTLATWLSPYKSWFDGLDNFFSYFDFLWKAWLVVLVIVWLHEGVRLLASGGDRKKALLMLASGISICVLMACLSFYVGKSMEDITNFHINRELPTDWGQNIEPDKREYISKNIASMT